MKLFIIVSITGTDQDGFFNDLTVKTRALGGKWLANKFAHLDGQFAALLKLEIEQDKLDDFKEVLNTYENIQVSYKDTTDASEAQGKPVKLTLEGEDRSGLTSDVTHLLTEQDVKVEHFESRRYPITELGTDVFEAHLDLLLPASLSIESLKKHLEGLAGRMRVFVSEA